MQSPNVSKLPIYSEVRQHDNIFSKYELLNLIECGNSFNFLSCFFLC